MIVWIAFCMSVFWIALHLLDKKYEWSTVIPDEIMKKLKKEYVDNEKVL